MGFGELFTWVLTIVGTLGGFFNPLIGLMAYLALSVLRPADLWYWVWSANSVPRFSYYVAIATIIGWAGRRFGDRQPFRGIGLPLFGLGLFLAAGTFATLTCEFNPRIAKEWLTLQYKIGLMVLLAVTLVRTPRQINVLAWMVTACLGYLAWVFNEQYYFQGYNRIYYRGFGGVDGNGVAMMMVMGVPLAFFMAFHARRWWAKFACLAAMLMLAHVVLFSFSRGGQLGLLLVGTGLFIAAMLKLPRKGLTLTLSIAFVAAVITMAGPQVREEFYSIFADREELDASAASRYDAAAAAIACIKDHPLGVGPRNFNVISNRYGLDQGKSVHNLFLQVGADYGIPGMVGLILFYAGTLVSTLRMTFHPTAVRLHWPVFFGWMCALSLGGFLVCSMFIGMETVETGFTVSLIALCTTSYVRRVAASEPASDLVPELEQVPPLDAFATEPAVGPEAPESAPDPERPGGRWVPA